MHQRSQIFRHLDQPLYDVLIIGAGINGSAAAAAAAGKGARVLLVDKHDFGSQTSANSSNLIWGGIKYLEQGEVKLVNELCRCRNQLLQRYPTRVREMRFLATIPKGFRKPAWMVYSGAWLYWLMGRGKTAIPRYHRLSSLKQPLIDKRKASAAVEYSDAWLVDNDARFTFDFARQATAHGALAMNYLCADSSWFEDGVWHTRLRDSLGQQPDLMVRSKALVNATGPWSDGFHQRNGMHSDYHHVLSKGIHLIVPRLNDVKQVLAFFASDGRLFFVIPMGHQTCIGTTDTRAERPEVGITDADRQFVLDNVNQHLDLQQPLSITDVIAERCGVRPLAVTGSASSAMDKTRWQGMSRKHIIEVDKAQSRLGIFGGKLTDCINIGNEVCDSLQSFGIELNTNDDWFGEPAQPLRDAFMAAAQAMGLNQYWCENLQEPLPERWWRRYGNHAMQLLEIVADRPEQLAPVFANEDLRVAEVSYAAEHEMVVSLEDFMRRRTMIELTSGKQALLNQSGLAEVARILFGEQDLEQLKRYSGKSADRVNGERLHSQ